MTTKTAAKQGTGSAPTMHCRGPSPPADAAMTTMPFTVLPYALFLASCRADGRSTVLLTCSRLLGRPDLARKSSDPLGSALVAWDSVSPRWHPPGDHLGHLRGAHEARTRVPRFFLVPSP